MLHHVFSRNTYTEIATVRSMTGICGRVMLLIFYTGDFGGERITGVTPGHLTLQKVTLSKVTLQKVTRQE
jgi:hypothetical protein